MRRLLWGWSAVAYPSLREGNTSCGFPAYVSWRAQKNEGVTIGDFEGLWGLESVAGLSLLLGASLAYGFAC